MLGDSFSEGSFQIAVDGTAASGKSTVARRLAERLQVSYLDTGKLYRAVALYLSRASTLEPTEWSVESVGPLLDELQLSLEAEAGAECRVCLAGDDVTERLAEPAIERATPFVARLPVVRERLLEPQQRLARHASVVLAGRDIGTVVLPQADLKIYLEANLHERAKRRLLQRQQQPTSEELQRECEALAQRDRRDAERECAPMVAAADAILLDSSNQGVEALVEQVLALLDQRLAQRKSQEPSPCAPESSRVRNRGGAERSEESLSSEPNGASA